MKRKSLVCAALLGTVSLGAVALAQSYTPAPVQNIHPTDLIQIIPNGNVSSQTSVANPKQIVAQTGYYKSSPATGFSYTFGANVSKAVFTPSTTLSTGTVVMPASPNDGAQVCFWSKQIITTLTVSANTGQSIADNTSTLAAAGHNCYLYSLSDATWNRNE